jgi:hypothetical protein
MDSSQFRNIESKASAANFRSCVGHWWAAMGTLGLRGDLEQQTHLVTALCYALVCRSKGDCAAAQRRELQEIDRQPAGWAMTLGDPGLPSAVRADIVAEYDRARGRKQTLEQAAAAAEALRGRVGRMLDPQAVIAQLHRLADVLGSFNATLGSLQLSRHVDKIVCHPDGRVEMRGTLLGLFEGAVELLSRPGAEAPAWQAGLPPAGHRPVTPRRRGRLRVPDLTADRAVREGDENRALDPQRIAGLPEPFFWAEAFVLPRRVSWAEAHAEAVAERRAAGLTMAELARHFGKTVMYLAERETAFYRCFEGMGRGTQAGRKLTFPPVFEPYPLPHDDTGKNAISAISMPPARERIRRRIRLSRSLPDRPRGSTCCRNPVDGPFSRLFAHTAR